MAITKVGAINTIPDPVSDWTNTVKHINGFINQVNSQAFILSDPLGTASPTIKQGCYINHGGTLYIVDTSDYAPSGSPADGNVYIKLTPSGDTLVGSFITDISSYSYSQQYGNMVSGSDMILPYLLVKSGASWTKYRYQPMGVSYGAISGTSADFTGAISGESVTANSIIPVELYSPEFMIYDGLKPITTKVINSQSGDIPIYTSNITQEVNQTTYTKYLESTGSIATGTIKVSFTLEVGSTSTRTIYGKIYVNGVPVGTERSLTVTSTTKEQTFVEDISVQYGDLVQIYSKLDALSPVGVRRVSALNLGTNAAINL